MNGMHTPIIRIHNTTDNQIIVHLLKLNTPKYFAFSEEADLLDYLAHHSNDYYVVELENQIVGCGGINFSDDLTVGKISWDIFHPDFQGKGIGTMLTKYRIEKLKEYEHLKTIAVRTSQHAFKFYEKCGFKLTEITKDYWAEGFDLYYMEYVSNNY